VILAGAAFAFLPFVLACLHLRRTDAFALVRLDLNSRPWGWSSNELPTSCRPPSPHGFTQLGEASQSPPNGPSSTSSPDGNIALVTTGYPTNPRPFETWWVNGPYVYLTTRSSMTTSFGSASDLAAALRRAELAHGEHEKRTGKADPNWPDWYAEYIVAEQAGTELPS
jgi:hypothetical protein